MNKNFLKLASVILVGSISFSTIGSTIVKANELDQNISQQTTERTNFKVMNDSLSNYEYTYDENGTSYKIVENIDLGSNTVQSQIFILDGVNYKLDSTRFYQLESNGKMKISYSKDGINSSEVIDTGVNAKSNQNISITEEDESLHTQLDSASSIPLGDWEYSRGIKRSTLAEQLTVGAILVVLQTLVEKKGVKILIGIANLYYNAKKQTVYYAEQTYYKYTLTGPKLPRAQKNVFYFYKDGTFNDYIYDSPVNVITYTPGFEPS